VTTPVVDDTPRDPALVHEATYRVRFDEAGPDGLLRTSGLLRYAQDVAWLHSTARGFDRDWYRDRQLTWLVRAAELEVLAPVPLGTVLTSHTAVVGQRRVWARRRGEFRSPDGSLAGWVHTDWVMIDGRGALTRIPSIFAEEFRIPETTAQIGRVPLARAPEGTPTRRFGVRPHELDPMDHVNNAVYLDWLEEAVLASAAGERGERGERGDLDTSGELRRLPRRYRLEYAAAADAGMALDDAAWQDDGGWSYRVTGVEGSDVFRARLEIGGNG
jgi:acyl-ACP thioesterase